jgi:thiol-disulfide isomerase/thioredoxin
MADISSYSSYSSPAPAKPSSGGCTVVVLALLAMAIGLAVLVGLSALVFLPLVQRDGAASHAAVGKRLPRLELVGLTGDAKSVELADLSGKVVLVNFWGTWCQPCRRELPHIAEIHRSFRHRNDFRVLAVSCGRGVDEDIDELRESTDTFLAARRIDLPTYADPQSTTRLAFDEVGRFGSYPTTLLLDRDGVIHAVWIGYEPGTEQAMVRQIELLLE